MLHITSASEQSERVSRRQRRFADILKYLGRFKFEIEKKIEFCIVMLTVFGFDNVRVRNSLNASTKICQKQMAQFMCVVV